MGTIERPAGPNGEVPKPLCYFVYSWKDALLSRGEPLGQAALKGGRNETL